MKILVKVLCIASILFGLLSILPHDSLADSLDSREKDLDKLKSKIFLQQTEAEEEVKNVKDNLFVDKFKSDTELKKIEKALFIDNKTIQNQVTSKESFQKHIRISLIKYIGFALIIAFACWGIYSLLKKWLG